MMFACVYMRGEEKGKGVGGISIFCATGLKDSSFNFLLEELFMSRALTLSTMLVEVLCKHVCMYVCMYVWMDVFMYVCIYLCEMYVSMYVYS